MVPYKNKRVVFFHIFLLGGGGGGKLSKRDMILVKQAKNGLVLGQEDFRIT